MELCYRLWLIYDKKELKRNNLDCDIFSKEVSKAIANKYSSFKLSYINFYKMKMRELFGITCVGLGMLLLHGKIEYVWPFVTVVWMLMR